MKKQPSRKGSKAWRKNVDIKQEEDAIEEKVTREIMGLDTSSAQELFVIDTLGSETLQKEAKKLKIDQEMELKSKVGSVISKLRKKDCVEVDTGYKTRKVSVNTLKKIKADAKVMSKQGVSVGDHEKKRRLKKQEILKQVKKSKGGYDLWDTPDTTNKVKLSKPLDKKPLIHPGMSYQPRDQDHQEILRIATEQEMKKIEAAKKLEESLSYPPELDLLSGDVTFAEDEEEEEGEDSNELDQEKTTKPTKPKSKADLNRKKRAAEKHLEEKQLSLQKKIAKDINK